MPERTYTPALLMSFCLIASSGRCEELKSQEKIIVRARYLHPSISEGVEHHLRNSQLEGEVRNAISHYKQELPKWWGVDFHFPLSHFRVTAVSGTGVFHKGATGFTFVGGEVTQWDMRIEGDDELITGILAHEMNHVFFASYFRTPLPRAIDEGAAQCIETQRYRRRVWDKLLEESKKGKLFSFKDMLSRMEYPRGRSEQETENLCSLFYLQSYFLVHDLISSHDKSSFLKFVSLGCSTGNFERSFAEVFGLSPETFSCNCEDELRKLTARKDEFVHLPFDEAGSVKQ